MQPDLVVGGAVVVPGSDLRVSFSRSGGPGGQNVNKVSSRVSIELDLASTSALTAAQKDRVRRLAGRRLSTRGVLRIVSQRTRDQKRNLEDARERLRALLAAALPEPEPRKPTRVPRAVKKARLEAKRRRSDVKRGRRRPGIE